MKKPNQPEDVIVKKVKAFPIAGHIKRTDGVDMPIQIVKLTHQGFLAEITDAPIKTGERFEVSFEFPVHHTRVAESVVMVKLYERWGASSAPLDSAAVSGIGIRHLVEMHFQNLSETGHGYIDAFLAQVQKRNS